MFITQNASYVSFPSFLSAFYPFYPFYHFYPFYPFLSSLFCPSCVSSPSYVSSPSSLCFLSLSITIPLNHNLMILNPHLQTQLTSYSLSSNQVEQSVCTTLESMIINNQLPYLGSFFFSSSSISSSSPNEATPNPPYILDKSSVSLQHLREDQLSE